MPIQGVSDLEKLVPNFFTNPYTGKREWMSYGQYIILSDAKEEEDRKQKFAESDINLQSIVDRIANGTLNRRQLNSETQQKVDDYVNKKGLNKPKEIIQEPDVAFNPPESTVPLNKMPTLKSRIDAKRDDIRRKTIEMSRLTDEKEITAARGDLEVFKSELEDFTEQYNQELASQSEAKATGLQSERDKQIQAAVDELMSGQAQETAQLGGIRTTGQARIENEYTQARKELEDALLSQSQKYGNIGGGNLARGGLFGGQSKGLAQLQTGRLGALSELESNIQSQAAQKAAQRQSAISQAMNILGNQGATTTANQRYYESLRRLGTPSVATPQFTIPQKETPWYVPALQTAGELAGTTAAYFLSGGNPLAAGLGGKAGRTLADEGLKSFLKYEEKPRKPFYGYEKW